MARFEHEVKIDAPVDVVWSVVSDPALLPHWFEAVDSVTATGVDSSRTFEWQEAGRHGTGVFTQVKPNELLAFELLEGDKRTDHTLRLHKAGGLFGGDDTGLEYVMEYDTPGGFLGEFVAGGNPIDERKVKHVAERVKITRRAEGKRAVELNAGPKPSRSHWRGCWVPVARVERSARRVARASVLRRWAPRCGARRSWFADGRG